MSQQRIFVAFPEPVGCPHCSATLPRSLFFTKLPFMVRNAECCGGAYRLHTGREILCSLFFGLAWSIIFLTAWLEFVSWAVCGLTILGIFTFAYWLSPNLIRVEKIRSTEDRRTRRVTPGRRKRRHGENTIKMLSPSSDVLS